MKLTALQGATRRVFTLGLMGAAAAPVTGTAGSPGFWFLEAGTGHGVPPGEVAAPTLGWARAAPEPITRWTHWPHHLLGLVVKYQQNPLRAARALAYVQVAMHDAWRLVSSATEGEDDAAELAAHRAASRVAEQLYPHEAAGLFEARFAVLSASLVVPASRRSQAESAGEAAADALVARSLCDGSGRVWPVSQRPAPFPGIWLPAYPLYGVNPAEGLAGQWRPWLLPSAARHLPPPAPRPGSEQHRQETAEVLEVARRLTPEQAAAAHRWHLDAGSVTPAGVWMQLALRALGHAADGTADDQDPGTAPLPPLTLAFTLRTLAALAVAMHDAFIACWAVKMRDWSERPITAIRRERDAGFAPLLVTPGFPAYVSGHATVSAAAAQVLANAWPAQAGEFATMAGEAAMSRLWGGIHFRSDNDEGLRLGADVGREVVDRMG